MSRLSLAFAPLLPVWLLWSLAGLCLAAILLALLRRASGAIWRGLGLALVLGWLSGPMMVRQDWRALPQTLLLMVDHTGSMQVGQRQAIADAAAERVRQEAAALPGVTVQTVPVDDDPQGGTRLVDAIDRAASAVPASEGGGRIAAVIAITDGQAHDAPDSPGPVFPPGNPDVPLHVLIPAAGEQTDRRLRVLRAPPFAIVGQNATLRVEIEDLGPVAPGQRTAPPTARLTLQRDGDPPLSRDVLAGTPQDITVPVSRPGPMLLSLTASTLPGEVSTENNRQIVQIDGVRDRLKVLLVSGTPNQGERVWRRLLKADPAVDLVHFTILRPPDKDDSTPLNDLALIAFPIRELFQDKIDQFDLIILDGFENRGILPMRYLRNIADFVRGGGGLLVTAGPEFIGPGTLQDTPLGEVLPEHVPEVGGLSEQRFQPTPTALGRRHPVTAGLPQMPAVGGTGSGGTGSGGTGDGTGDGSWGDWYRALIADPSQQDPAAQVLLDGPNGSPLLVLDRVGEGRVALLLSDQLWLWSRGEGGGGPQAELLRRLAHWLMKEPDLEEERLTASIAGGTLTVTRHSVAGQAATSVMVTTPDGGTSTLALSPRPDGSATASLPATLPGIWQASIGNEHAFAAARPADPLEIADLRATADVLAPLARATGGSVAWLGDDPASAASRVPSLRLVDTHDKADGSGWIGLKRHGAHVVTGERARALLPAWLVMPLALLLLLFGWYREGRGRS